MLSKIRTLALGLFHAGKTMDAYLAEHDAVHVQVAKLEPIEINGHWVDGIAGINIADFHADYETRIAAYDGWLDEYRVQAHVVLTNFGIYSVGAYLVACSQMLKVGINPIAVLLKHKATLC